MRLMTSRRIGSDLRYIVHLDPSKTVPDPGWNDPGDGSTRPLAPDPEWVMDQTYGAGPRSGAETAPQFVARLTAFEASARREMRALCAERLAAMQARGKPGETGVALAGEGAAL